MAVKVVRLASERSSKRVHSHLGRSELCLVHLLYTVNYKMLKFSLICFLSTGILLLAPLSVSAGSCREAGLCCPGRDTSCVAQKSSANDIFQDIYDRPCYCDHSCMILNDCCHDYKQHCGGKLQFCSFVHV